MDEAFCPVAETARLIGDEYVLLILRDLAGGAQRFTALGNSVSVNAKTLTERLRRMEGQGLLRRTVYPEIPPRVEYALTAKGEALLPILDAIRQYGERWLAPEPTAARADGGAPDC